MTKQKQTKEQLISYYDFLNFFHHKGSLFYQGIYNSENEKYEYHNIKYNEVINFKTKEEKTNLFFTINNFSKNRKSKNIKGLNCFYFDLDFKDNDKDVKHNIESIIDKTKDFFDIIIKSRGGYHFYRLLKDGEYELDEKEKYLEDWKQLGKNIEILFGIKLDEKIYDVSRISRIPYSYHKKTHNHDLFLIEIIKGKEIISPLNERLKQINQIPIILVLEKLIKEGLINDVEIKNGILYRKYEISDGLKIKEGENYIKDFSHNYTGNPFSLTQKLYSEKIEKYNFEKNIKNEKNEIYSRSIIETYSFFGKYFGILNSNIIKKNIIIPKIIEDSLYDFNLNNIELKYFLGLLNYAQGKNNNTYYIGKEIKIELNEFIKYNCFDTNVSKNKEYLEKLFLNPIFKKNEKNNFHFLKGKIVKENNKNYLYYTIIPGFYTLGSITKNKFYFKHYIDKKILNIPTNGNYFNFTFGIFINLINVKNKEELKFEKEEIIEKIGDSNFQRIKKKLLEINKNLGDIFEIKREGKSIIFLKK